MSKKKNDKTIPSLFILCSPFQVLCAKEAIEHFHIKDYSIHILLPEEMSYRDKQMLHLLDTLELSYKTFHYRASNLKYEKIKIFKYQFSKYKRAFIGDFRDMRLVYTALKLISNGGTIIYLDDGAINIALLKGVFSFPNRLKYKLPYFASKVRSIRFDKDIFTIYSDISNHNYNLYKNSLSYFRRYSFVEKEGIYVIGTNPREYVVGFNISLSQFKDSLDNILLQLANDYPQETIYYIAHGSDDYFSSLWFCHNERIVYVRPHEMVELYLLNRNNAPRLVIGFTSSALYNIKLIYPDSEICNYLYYTKKDEGYNAISSYYQLHGIKLKLFH